MSSERGHRLSWLCRDQVLEVGRRTAVMGILNVTPDSFSDGGCFLDPERAVARGRRMADEGADILDIGGESTRPGAEPVTSKEERERVLPVLQALAGNTRALLSIDTTKADVAAEALEAGAHIVNDVSAMTSDPAMAGVVRDYGAGVVLMHRKGSPSTMQQAPAYADVVREVGAYLKDRIRAAEAAGIEPGRICVDPGIGFGKTVAHNLALLSALPTVCGSTQPILVGASRKSLIGALLQREAGDRLAGSLGLAAYAVMRGAHVVRVHDVIESCDVVRLIDILEQEETHHGAVGEF